MFDQMIRLQVLDDTVPYEGGSNLRFSEQCLFKNVAKSTKKVSVAKNVQIGDANRGMKGWTQF